MSKSSNKELSNLMNSLGQDTPQTKSINMSSQVLSEPPLPPPIPKLDDIALSAEKNYDSKKPEIEYKYEEMLKRVNE